jgi:hypothetical protein
VFGPRAWWSSSISYDVWLKNVGADPFQRENIPLRLETSCLSKNYRASSLSFLPRLFRMLPPPSLPPSLKYHRSTLTHILLARDLAPDPHPIGRWPKHRLGSTPTPSVCYSSARVMKRLLKWCRGNLLLVGAAPPQRRHFSLTEDEKGGN